MVDYRNGASREEEVKRTVPMTLPMTDFAIDNSDANDLAALRRVRENQRLALERPAEEIVEDDEADHELLMYEDDEEHYEEVIVEEDA